MAEANDGGQKRTSTQALHVIPSIRSSHVSDGLLVSGSSSSCGSSTEPPAKDLLSKFVNTLNSDGIIGSSSIAGAGLVGLGTRVGGIKRRPAYRRAGEKTRTPGKQNKLLFRASNPCQRAGNCLPNLETATFHQFIWISLAKWTAAQNQNGTTEEIKNTQGSTRHTQSVQNESSHKRPRPNPVDRHESKGMRSPLVCRGPSSRPQFTEQDKTRSTAFGLGKTRSGTTLLC